MKYNKIINEKGIEYGIVKGNDIVFYIKVGNEGNIYGYKNKYLSISIRINKEYGYTVIVSSNPCNIREQENIERDMSFINTFMQETPIIYAFGFSNGGMMLSNQSYRYENIKKVLICNTPLMINFHKIKEGVKLFNQESLVFVFGSYDQSYAYLPLLENIENDRIKIFKLEGIDHLFKGHLDDFIELPFKYILNYKN